MSKKTKNKKKMSKMTNRKTNNQNKISLNTVQVKCDKCNELFHVGQNSILTEHPAPDVQWNYFECPNCRMLYTTYIGDNKISNMIEQRNKIRKEINIVSKKYPMLANVKIPELYQKDNNLAEKIAQRTQKLRKELNLNEKEQKYIPKEFRKSDS